jgi:hypothetical protein
LAAFTELHSLENMEGKESTNLQINYQELAGSLDYNPFQYQRNNLFVSLDGPGFKLPNE